MDIFQGSLSLVYVIISYILGISILSKYFEFETRDYIFVGVAWMGISNPWLPDAISFIMIVFIQSNLSPEVSFIIGYAILPFFILCWLIAFIIFTISFEIIFFFLLFTDPNLIGIFVGPFQIRWSLLMQIYLCIFISIAVISGIMFARVSIKSHNPEVSLKGKLISAAFISFALAAFIEAFFHLDPLTVVITRSILISSSIEFYLGFILPKWGRNFFLKGE